MSDSDLMFRGAVELAAMVRSGEVSARELVASSRSSGSRSSTRPSTRSSTSTASVRWRPPSRSVPGDERPFAGVPVAVKNNRPVAGLRLTYGCALMENYVCDYDHNVTRRLRGGAS